MAISHGHCQSKNKTYDNEILRVSKPKSPHRTPDSNRIKRVTALTPRQTQRWGKDIEENINDFLHIFLSKTNNSNQCSNNQ